MLPVKCSTNKTANIVNATTAAIATVIRNRYKSVVGEQSILSFLYVTTFVTLENLIRLNEVRFSNY